MVASSVGLDGVTFDALQPHEVDAAFALEVAGAFLARRDAY